jgi:hypothetical protein
MIIVVIAKNFVFPYCHCEEPACQQAGRATKQSLIRIYYRLPRPRKAGARNDD